MCIRDSLGTLLRQYYPAPEPEVRIVDMREELKHGHKLIFSRELLTDLEQTLENHGQALLFLNRREMCIRDRAHSLQRTVRYILKQQGISVENIPLEDEAATVDKEADND